MNFAHWIATAAVLLGGSAAEAATYSMSAACVSACADAGLAVGDMLTGRLTVDSSTFVPNGSFGDAALQGFSISFGATRITSDNVVAAHLDGQWGATRRDVPAYDLVGGTTVMPNLGATFLLSGSNGFVSTAGSCIDANCDAITGNTATLSPVALAPIPLPGSGPLLGGGLVLLAAAGWREKQGRARSSVASPS